MKNFLIDAFIKPFVGLVFFIGFGGFFVFGGFQSVNVDLQKDINHAVNGQIARSHFFGFYKYSIQLSGIREVLIETRKIRGGKAGHSKHGVSGVVIAADSGETALFWGFSNVDEKYKRQIVQKLNEYIQSNDINSFSEIFTIRNLFGWFGLPFFLIGLLGAVTWPLTIMSCWRKRNASSKPAAG